MIQKMIQRLSVMRVMINILIVASSIETQGILDHSIAQISPPWIKNISDLSPIVFENDIEVIPILVRQIPGRNLAYACGFFCYEVCDTLTFSIFSLAIFNDSGVIEVAKRDAKVLWSANRNNPVQLNAIMQLTSEGDLILRDAGGELVWSTNTAGRSVSGLNMTESGNLVLFDVTGSMVWQSFDHPTDSLLPGQRLKLGQSLVSSVSLTNQSEGFYSFTVTNDGLFFSVGSNPPEVYYHRRRNSSFQNGNLTSDHYSFGSVYLDKYITPANLDSRFDRFLQLGSNGHLTHFQRNATADRWEETDILKGELRHCQYPMACGEYGICAGWLCSCPQSLYPTMSSFVQNHFTCGEYGICTGCSHITPLDCSASHLHGFVEVEKVTYFMFKAELKGIDRNSCKKACLANCSCKAAIFRFFSDSLIGDCYLPSQIYSLVDNYEVKPDNYSISIFLKVQSLQTASEKASHGKSSVPLILGFICGGLILLVIVCGLTVLMIRKRMWGSKVREENLRNVTRFSFEDLNVATDNFSIKLGQGGFGCVYQGSLKDGTKIAVKHIDRIGGAKKSFLAEIESIGSIHHVNLVRLVGYCAEKSYRLLVYDYMVNGSLDKWIYSKRRNFPLDWKCRKKIVLGVAKALAYLHKDCMHKIIHLDVKPQNILLDENFDPKLSDFGLSKLMSRDQSKIVTSLKGTPGYLAPEWLSFTITEKVDVYSFGVVIMEMLCGREVLDFSQAESSIHLTSLFAQKGNEGQLWDLVDKSSEDMQSNKAEVMKMMQVAAWCLQNEFSSRPSMSFLVEVLEGVIDVDLTNLAFSFISPYFSAHGRSEDTLIIPSVLSGPR